MFAGSSSLYQAAKYVAGNLRWSDWSLTDMESYVPTYEDHGGPGWTNRSRDPNAPATQGVNDLDKKFGKHDNNYGIAKKAYEATGDYAEYRRDISNADRDLLNDLKEVDWNDPNFDTPEKLTQAKAYASMAEKAFTAKSAYNEVMENLVEATAAMTARADANYDTVSDLNNNIANTVDSVASNITRSLTSLADAAYEFVADRKDDLANAKAPESTIAQYGMRDEIKNKQDNAEQTEDDIEQAQQGDGLNDQKAAEPPPPSGDEGGNNPPSPRPGCGDSGPPSNNSGNSGGGCSIDDSSDDVNDGWSEPIVLDLNQNGEIELTALDQSNAFYDFDGDEYLNRVGWVSGDDGFLAIDIGGDGIIKLGSEIAFADFGRYAVGQLELAEEVEAYLAEHGLLNENLDFNGDGVVDVADFDSDRNGLISDLEGLRYFDSNADGVIDSGDSWECGRLARRVVVNPKYEDSAFGQMGWN